MPRPTRSAALLALFGTLLFSVLWSAPAFAHVSLTPSTAAAGSTVDLSFSIPNERTDSNTTKIEVIFGPQQAVTTADTPSKTGWSSSVNVGAGGSVSSVVWERGSLAPGKTDTFVATVKVPATGDKLVLKTLQTYSNGDVVRWIDEPTASGAEPEHPAPILTITGGAATTTVAPTTTLPTTTTTLAPEDGDDSSSGFSTGSLFILGGIGVLILLYQRNKHKRKTKDE